MPKQRRDEKDPREVLPTTFGLRGRLERAALEESGLSGYPELTVNRIVKRAETTRTAFYGIVSSKEACFAAAYATAVDELADRLLASCREAGDWRAGVVGALDVFASFVTNDPPLANGVLVQARIAGGSCAEKRVEVVRRLAGAIDRAREGGGGTADLPRLAPDFILSAIEEMAVSALAREAPHEFAEATNDLAYLAVATYFGPEAAAEDRQKRA
jgi:AcrR family transcriptional regulator